MHCSFAALAEDNKGESSKQSKNTNSTLSIEQEAIANDPELRAFKDELARTESKLTLGGQPPPYYTAYQARELTRFNIYGSFGALDRVDDSRQKFINVDVRIGDRKFDSDNGSNFTPIAVSLDDNYDALRHSLWLSTDAAYKRAIEGLESKKAALQQKKVLDLPESLAPAKALVSIEPKSSLLIDKAKWMNNVRDISAVFKKYPAVVNSEVSLLTSNQNRWFINSEGSLNREGDSGAVIGITASGLAKDGMDVADFEMFGSNEPGLLPAPEFLKTIANGLAERINALTRAPIIEDYRGPVLFEKQAAAEFFAQTLTPSLINPRPSRLSNPFASSGLKEKIGRRILPKSVSVIDDPLAKEFNGVPLKGGYQVDDEGVKGQKVVLVEDGILKTLCAGRTPSRYIRETNGHGRSINGASPSILFINSKESKPLPELKSELMRMGREDGLPYVLIVRRIATLYLQFFNAGEPGFKTLRAGLRNDQISLTAPTLIYKVNVQDGSEELVRGAKFEHLNSRIWRDIVALGNDQQPYIVLTAGLAPNTTSSSIVTPSILISEMDITKAQQEGDKPMFLNNPYFDKSIRLNQNDNVQSNSIDGVNVKGER